MTLDVVMPILVKTYLVLSLVVCIFEDVRTMQECFARWMLWRRVCYVVALLVQVLIVWFVTYNVTIVVTHPQPSQ